MSIDKKIENFLTDLKIIEPREELFSRVISAVYKKQAMAIKIKLTGAVLVFCSASLSLFYLGAGSISATGRLLSLFFSDFDVVIANWKYYSFYFLESAPIVFIFGFLLLIFLSLTFLKILIQRLPDKNYLAV